MLTLQNISYYIIFIGTSLRAKTFFCISSQLCWSIEPTSLIIISRYFFDTANSHPATVRNARICISLSLLIPPNLTFSQRSLLLTSTCSHLFWYSALSAPCNTLYHSHIYLIIFVHTAHLLSVTLRYISGVHVSLLSITLPILLTSFYITVHHSSIPPHISVHRSLALLVTLAESANSL